MNERLHGLDWLRVGAFGLLILYHVGMFFVPWDWHIKTARPVAWLELPMMAVNAWRLPLLFLISGAASAFLLARASLAGFARSRATRLLPPLLFGVAVIVPPQAWVELAFKHGYLHGFGHFWTHDYFRFAGIDGVVVPTWNHLWFVGYLFAYSLLLAAVAATVPAAVCAKVKAAMAWLAKGSRLLALPVGGLFVLRVTLYPRFPVTHALVDDWYTHAEALLMFTLGLLLARGPALRDAIVRQRRQALALAVAGFGVFAAYWAIWGDDGIGVPRVVIAAARLARAALCWGAIVTLVGFALFRLNRDGPARRYLTEAVFPFYIAHQTIIVLAAWWLRSLALGTLAEFLVLVAITAAGCLAFHELARRSGPLRPLFGLAARRLPARVRQATITAAEDIS